MGEGWSAKWLNNRTGGEWDWKLISKACAHDGMSAGSKDDDGNDRSVHSVGSSVGERASSSGKQPLRSPTGSQGVSISTSPGAGASSSRVSSRLTTTAGGRSGVTSQSMDSPRGVSTSSKASSTKQSSTSSTRAPSISNPGYSYPVSPRRTRHNVPLQKQQQHSAVDPHPHPTAPPPPASALSIWLIAHRYAMPGLSSLALTHIMNT